MINAPSLYQETTIKLSATVTSAKSVAFPIEETESRRILRMNERTAMSAVLKIPLKNASSNASSSSRLYIPMQLPYFESDIAILRNDVVIINFTTSPSSARSSRLIHLTNQWLSFNQSRCFLFHDDVPIDYFPPFHNGIDTVESKPTS